MNETSTDEQDLAKALDSVATAASNLGSPVNAVNNQPAPTASSLPPIVPPDSPVAPAPNSQDVQNQDFPKIIPIHDSSDVFYKPNLSTTPPSPKVSSEVATNPNNTIDVPVSNQKQAESVKSEVSGVKMDTKENDPFLGPENPVSEQKPDIMVDKKNDVVNEITQIPEAPMHSSDEPLENIKKDALSELRPLVDKLNVPPEEKFDALLLLIRSTDDTELVAPAHEAAKSITDSTRRAEALLEIIKEIDYLSRKDSDK